MVATRIVALSGDLDIFTQPSLRAALADVDGPVTLDLSEVTLLCAAGLTEIARLVRRVGVGRVTLTGANRHIRRVLGIVRFDQICHIPEAVPEDPGTAGTYRASAPSGRDLPLLAVAQQ